MSNRQEKIEAFGRLLDVLNVLRAECPWDKKQTENSLRPNTIEEVFELSDAIIKQDVHNVCKELGDVLLHVCFYARISEEHEDFDIKDVCNQLVDKLIYRHPHVYRPSQIGKPHPIPISQESEEEKSEEANGGSITSELVVENWEKLKLKEKDGNKSVLAGVPDALPSIIKAYRIQDKTRNVGFDWENSEDVWDKVHEEIDELKKELAENNHDRSVAEFGDFLFSMINVARHYHINPDTALERTNQKFVRRFNYIEEKCKGQGRELMELSLAEMDEWWNEAKRKEHENEE